MNQLSECTLPWFELQIEYNGNAGFCCYYSHKRQEINIHGRLDIPNIWNSPPFQAARSIIRSNNPVGTGCAACQNFKYPSLFSYLDIPSDDLNKAQKDNWKLAIDNLVEKRTIVDSLPVKYYFNFGLSCNINCIMCSQRNFHQQYKEHLSADILYSHKEFLKIANEIVVIGGEPLYIPQAVEFISKIVHDRDFDDTLLTIVTNGSLLDKHFDLIKSHRRLNLFVSLDSVGQTYNSIRRGSKWEKVADNLKRIKRESLAPGRQWNVFVSCVVMKSSLANLPNFVDWCIDNGIRCFFVPLFGMDFTVSEDIFNYPTLLKELPGWEKIVISSIEKLKAVGWDIGGTKSLQTMYYDLSSSFQTSQVAIGNNVDRRQPEVPEQALDRASDKALSIVVVARNDNYCGNFIGRIKVFINSLFSLCHKFRRKMELVIIEWNPPAENKRLIEALDWSHHSNFLEVRFVEVPHIIHTQIPNHEKMPLFEYIAKNVGVARCSAEYILVTNPDIIFSDELFDKITSRTLSPAAYYRVNRFDVDSSVIPQTEHDEIVTFCRENAFRVHAIDGTVLLDSGVPSAALPTGTDKVHTNAAGDFFLMSQAHWHRLKGYPEFPTSTFVDGYICYMAASSGMDQCILEEPLFHQEHDRGEHALRPKMAYGSYSEQCEAMLAQGKPTIFNNESWGMQQVPLFEYSLADLEFTKDADTWISTVIQIEQRPNYKDQTPRSLLELRKIAEKFKPTLIIEIGTSSGMSLRTWLSLDDVRVVAIDLSFSHLQTSHKYLPIDSSRLKLFETDILNVDISEFWNKNERVLVFVDAHDMPGVPIMEKLLLEAFPNLPSDNLVVVDDLWYSPKLLTKDTIRSYFADIVLKEIDPTQDFSGKAAHYWEGGSFFGFDEVIPLMSWMNTHQVKALHNFGKCLYFQYPSTINSSETIRPEEYCSDIVYTAPASI